MEEISYNRNNHNQNTIHFNSKSEKLEHDPLPPAVDFTVIWPVLLVLFCLIFSLMAGGDSIGFKGTVGFCTNEADPQTSMSFGLKKVPQPPTGKQSTAWYPAKFEPSTSENPLPCVRWFGESYPIKTPFENITTTEPHSYYTPPPTSSWFNWLFQKKSRENNSQDDQPVLWGMPSINQTVYYTTANAQIAQALGTFPGVNQSFFSTTWPPKDPNIVYNATGTGILGAIPVRFASSGEYLPSNGSRKPEFTVKFSAPRFLPFQNQEALDQAIVEMVTRLTNRSSYSYDERMPFGGVIFNGLNPQQSNVKMTMQFGQQPTSYYGPSLPTSGLRQMIMMTQISNALVKTKFAGQYVISQGLRALPMEWKTDSFNGYNLNRLSEHLFPFGLSFLLPTFVSIMVTEKENRHRMMMAMNGLKSSSYYLGHYVEFMTMQLILSLFFSLAALAVRSPFILRTNPLIVVVLLIVWSHVQVAMAFVFASLFSSTRRATLIVYFFVAISCIMASVAKQIFKDGVPFAWFIHPSFSFFNILARSLKTLTESSLLYFYSYFDAVAPSEYGVQKPWHFPITYFFRKRKASRDPESHVTSHARDAAAHPGDDDKLEGADADVYAERDRVRTQYDPSKTPLIIDNLFHRYPGKIEPALRGMSFGVETNSVLGLLGPNGAGKSTMIHLLTGLYSPTSGTAHVAGADIRTDMATVHSKIGVCPQHDILWGELSVADHLLFYSRLRGIPPRLEQQAVTFAIASVSLTKFRDRAIKGLSGGERRRVSIAIALLGDNSVIFLDEPSTGLDPAVRRVIWDIINRVKVNRTIVLTTHSMEEADILSDRIAIMTTGRLRCIGTSLHLKELYGSGFRLNITSKPGLLEEACESVANQLLKGMKYRRIDKFTNATTFEFEPQQQQQQQSSSGSGGRGQLSKIFSSLSQPAMFPAVEDWGVSQTSLEDVFIKIVTEGDSAIAMPAL
ncbi:hypothetical protein BGZ65_006714 [Modicella reniformis]|uniref:ABC transporter domain-containing protein n=1 Tax=Modicella reniformis TaxID=1440133 RepID=A0A9P6M2C7_9FUNG|nr:hypothetical protein BGZ65_006714 [Modicella reniformis]